MPEINATEFGSVTVDGKKYSQVLITGSEVIERDYDRLKDLFGTSHKIGDWETEILLSNHPGIIVVGTGQDGVLDVDDDFKERMTKSGIDLVIEKTPHAIATYNALVKEGKRVAALIHTTC